ncbi:MAG: putative replicase [Circoviridae sp.]|nr:MAG: putative replicase [Circoviridae sp.]
MPKTLLSLILEQSGQEEEKEQLSFFNKYNKLHMEESTELIRIKFKKILSQEYQLERMGLFAKKLQELEAQNAVLLKQKQAFKKQNSHLFITINPKPVVKLSDFTKVCHKISKKTCFNKVLYVFEQRGTIEGCDIGKGFHCHLLIERNLNYKPTKCITNIKSSLKKFVGNVNNQHQLNCQVIGNEFAVDKKNYILGKNKTGEGKDAKQIADIKWRFDQNITPFYGCEKII